MDDLISRRTAQRLFAKALTYQEHVGRYKWITAEMKQWIADFIEDLPSAQPERKKGRWIYGEHDIAMCDGYRCDKCGFFVPWDYKFKFIDFINDYHFCPNCGADMRGEEDGNE